jgi:hypothetical protein
MELIVILKPLLLIGGRKRSPIMAKLIDIRVISLLSLLKVLY